MVMRVWVVSGLIVAAVVAGILVFSDGSRPEIDTPRTQPTAPSPLTEQEVRTYLTVWPQINEVLGVAVKAMGDPGAPGVNKKDLGERVRAAVEAILAQHHLNTETWGLLRRRVEHAVDVVRWRSETKGRNADLDGKILEKQRLLELAEGRSKKLLEADIEALQAQRVAGGPVLLQRDVELVQSFWRDLDAIAPTRGSPSKKQN